MTTAQALLADLPDGEAIPLPWIRDRVGWSRDAQSYAVKAGVIRPLPGHGPHRSYQVSRADAVEILIAAALAVAAGIAVVAMLRAIQGAGLNAEALASAVKT